MKKILIVLTIGLLLAQNAFALQEVAGPLVMSIPLGGSNSTRWGLINDENETITVSLNASESISKYLSFPATVDLPYKKIVYTNITANIPIDYDFSLGRNITGYLYALQQGEPGQVQINVQMVKSITIMVIGEPKVSEQASTQTNSENSQMVQTSPATGFVALISTNAIAIVLVIALIVIVFMFFEIQKLKKNQKIRR